jgi:hypothetical protein
MERKIRFLIVVLLFFLFHVPGHSREIFDITQLQGSWLGYWDIDFYGGKCWIGLEIDVKSSGASLRPLSVISQIIISSALWKYPTSPGMSIPMD